MFNSDRIRGDALGAYACREGFREHAAALGVDQDAGLLVEGLPDGAARFARIDGVVLPSSFQSPRLQEGVGARCREHNRIVRERVPPVVRDSDFPTSLDSQ